MSSRCMLLIIYSLQKIANLFFGRTLGYTAKLSDITMVPNFFKRDNYLLCYVQRDLPPRCLFVKDRMEGSGMRWSVPGAQFMLNLRCVYLNEDWRDFHDYRIKNRVRNMYPYRHLVQ